MVNPRLKLKQLHWEREGFELLAWDWWCWASIPLCALCFHIIWKLPSWTFTVDLTLSFLPRWFVPWLCLPHVYNYRRFLQAGRLQHVWFLQRDARSSWIYRSKYKLLSFASKILLSFLISPFKVFQAPAAGTECVICMLEITAEELQFWILWRRCARLFFGAFSSSGAPTRERMECHLSQRLVNTASTRFAWKGGGAAEIWLDWRIRILPSLQHDVFEWVVMTENIITIMIIITCYYYWIYYIPVAYSLIFKQCVLNDCFVENPLVFYVFVKMCAFGLFISGHSKLGS